ncbi:MAG: hypothetical protein AAF611_06340 [Bacteroidota bacterium]
MKKLSLHELKDKLNVINESEVQQSIAGGDVGDTLVEIFDTVDYYVHEVWYWLTED